MMQNISLSPTLIETSLTPTNGLVPVKDLCLREIIPANCLHGILGPVAEDLPDMPCLDDTGVGFRRHDLGFFRSGSMNGRSATVQDRRFMCPSSFPTSRRLPLAAFSTARRAMAIDRPIRGE